MNSPPLQRILIIGTSCSGKSTLGDQISQQTGMDHLELDTLYWRPGWKHITNSDLQSKVREVSERKQWIISGNYSQVREILWSKATDLIWLDLSLPLVLYRALTRTITRLITQEYVCNGNRENTRSLLSFDGIPFWVLRTHFKYRYRYEELINSDSYTHLRIHRLYDPQEIPSFLKKISHLHSRDQRPR